MKRSKPARNAAVTPLGPRACGAAGTRVGFIAGVSTDGLPLVELPECAEPLEALTTVAATAAELAAAAARRQPVVVLFEDGDARRPIVVGFVVQAVPATALEPVPGGLTSLVPDLLRLDGKRVRLEGAEEVVLVCGQASIVLQRSGRVVVRGTQVETDADGVNRIKGAAVRIN
jgi:Domain of unknown function (DUF6484)